MDELITYRACHTFTATGEDRDQCIDIFVDDVLEVRYSPEEAASHKVENPDDWLTGHNVRTGKSGFFPGTYVVFETREQLPSALPPLPVGRPPQPGGKNGAHEGNDSGYCGSPSGQWGKKSLEHIEALGQISM